MIMLTLIFSFFTATISHAAIVGGEYSIQECTYDFAVQGGAVGFIDICGKKALPVGSYIVDGFYIQQTAFTSGGSATVALGDATSGARYLAATAYNNGAFAAGFIAKYAIGTPVSIAAANTGKLGITVATAALTGGKMKMMVLVYKPKL